MACHISHQYRRRQWRWTASIVASSSATDALRPEVRVGAQRGAKKYSKVLWSRNQRSSCVIWSAWPRARTGRIEHHRLSLVMKKRGGGWEKHGAAAARGASKRETKITRSANTLYTCSRATFRRQSTAMYIAQFRWLQYAHRTTQYRAARG